MNKKNPIKLFKTALLILPLIFSLNAKAQQWGDYTLYATMQGTTAKLIDTNSTVFKTWTFTTNQKTCYSSYLQPGGTLYRTVAKSGNSFTGGPICGKVQRVDWSGAITWDFDYSTLAYCTHHDICPMPNGNVLMIAYERKSAAEVAAAGCNTFFNEMWPDKIIEVQPTGTTTGTIVWEWHAWDHLVQNVDSLKANYHSSIVNHPELLNINYNATKDWMHMNGVDYNPILDQISFSSHNLDEIYVIDHSTTTAEAASHAGGNSGKGGDLLYRWGRPGAYSASGAQIINVVHDAHWIPEGVPNAGYLVGFNNNGTNNNQSYVDQVNPPVNGYNYNITSGQAFTPASYTLRHTCNGYTSNMGNSQQLPNGNMLVCIATAGNVYEVDPSGNTIWSFNTGASNPKAFRYNNCYINNPAPHIPVITQNGNVLTADSGVTFQWYMNGVLLPGETNQSYTPTQNGIYVVRVTDSNSCEYSYSSGFNTITGIETNVNTNINILNLYPNPTSGIVNIDKTNFNNDDYTVTVYNAYGKIILQKNNLTLVDLSGNANGIYNITIRSAKAESINKKIVLIK